jgi:CheY-like chemotaxis protein
MARVVLVDWNATAAKAGLATLRRAGHETRVLVPKDSASFKVLLEKPPEAILVDLTRRPSEGRNVGVWLRQRKATRSVPLLFVGGEPEKVQRTRALLPDATYAPWTRVRSALRAALRARGGEALRARRSAPVVRGSMEAYSGTPLPKKLGIKADTRVLLLGAGEGFEKTLGKLPEGVRLQRRLRGQAHLVLLFAKSQADLQRRFAGAAKAVAAGGSLWILWRKQASGQATDLGPSEVRAYGLERGFVDYKIASIDAVWSGLRFARRRRGG